MRGEVLRYSLAVDLDCCITWSSSGSSVRVEIYFGKPHLSGCLHTFHNSSMISGVQSVAQWIFLTNYFIKHSCNVHC